MVLRAVRRGGRGGGGGVQRARAVRAYVGYPLLSAGLNLPLV
jgi:hypothetical protein